MYLKCYHSAWLTVNTEYMMLAVRIDHQQTNNEVVSLLKAAIGPESHAVESWLCHILEGSWPSDLASLCLFLHVSNGDGSSNYLQGS